MPKSLEAKVRKRPGVAVVDLKGEINSHGEQVLNAAYDEAERSSMPAILLNLQDVNYINSTGIALLVSLLTRARNTGRHLSTSGLSPHYAEIFHITRLSDFMTIYPNEEAALEGMAR